MASIISSTVSSAASAAHAAAVTATSASQITPGSALPTTAVKETSPETSSALEFGSGKIIILGVPGAFSPTCSSQVPGYISEFEKFKSKGVTEIFVVAVNDVFVTK
jgi:peroxiredoxin